MAKRKAKPTLHDVASDSLGPVSAGLAGVFVCLFAGHVASFPPQLGIPLGGLALMTATLFLAGRAIVGRETPSAICAHVIEAGIVLAAVIHGLLLPAVTGEIRQTSHLLLLLVASGSVLLSPGWLAAVIVAANGGWAWLVLHLMPDSDWPYWALSLALANILAVFVFWVRKRSLGRLELARAEQELRRARLEDPLRELRASEERCRQFAAATSDGLIIHRDGEILDYNDNAARLFSASPSWLTTKRLGEILEECEPTQDGDLMGIFSENVRGGFAICADGGRIPVEVSRRAIHHDGRGAEVVALRDISARKVALTALAAQRARERAILESALDCIVTIDHEGRILGWNPASAATFGYTRDEALGRNFAELVIPQELRDAHNEGISRNLETGHSEVIGKRIEAAAMRADGTEFPVELAVARLEAAHPAVFTAYLRDITERKRGEADLSRARDQAVKASRVKSEFLATMSHEIRTPMNGVLGMVGLLLDTNLSEVQRRQASAIKQSGDALLTIINDILDFSKIEAGKLELEDAEFDLHKVIDETVELLSAKVEGKPVEVAGHIANDVPANVIGDAGRLRQIILNLLGNAVKFTAEGEVIVRVALACEEDDGLVLLFEVEDTGPGIDAPTQKRLFQPFVQGDASMSRRYAGSGLGLAVSRQLAELMGGSIGVESKPGRGSTFWFTARLRRGSETTARVHSDLGGKRVLIVAESQTTRNILSTYMGAWGLSCGAAGSAVEALSELRRALRAREPYDVGIVDADLSGSGGLALARDIAANVVHRNVRLIMLAAMNRLGSSQIIDEPAVLGIVAKPVSKSQLFNSLMDVVCGGQLASRDDGRAVPSLGATEKATRSLHILVAEDNLVNQEVVRQMLDNLGHRADIVANGLEAVNAASRFVYDVVFMDCQMPEMDGFEATRAIREREREGSRIPIVAMTANAMQGDRERCLAVGMDDYVPKPVDPALLKSTLERWASGGASDATCEGSSTGAIENDPGPIVDDLAPSGDLDISVLKGLRERQRTGKPDFVTRLIDLYVDQTSSYLDSLRAAVARADAAELERIAHAIKGSSANLGARGMARISAKLQELGRSGTIDGSERLVGNLEGEFECVRVILESQRLGSSSAGS